jgi:hypothetical protein
MLVKSCKKVVKSCFILFKQIIKSFIQTLENVSIALPGSVYPESIDISYETTSTLICT